MPYYISCITLLLTDFVAGVPKGNLTYGYVRAISISFLFVFIVLKQSVTPPFPPTLTRDASLGHYNSIESYL